MFFLPAVIVAGAAFGRNTGFVGTVLSTAVITFFLLPPQFSFAQQRSSDVINTAIYVGVSLFVTALVEALHKAYVEAEQAHQGTDAARRRAEAALARRYIRAFTPTTIGSFWIILPIWFILGG